jgi:hypothetical protein
MGRVKNKIVSRNGRVRKAVVRVGDSTLYDKGKRRNCITLLERPIHKLVLLLE